MCCTRARRVAHFACCSLLTKSSEFFTVGPTCREIISAVLSAEVCIIALFEKSSNYITIPPKEQLYSFRQTDQPNENYQIGLVCTGSLKLQEGAKGGHVEIIFRERNNKQYGTVTLNINITNSQRTHNAQRSSQHIVSLSKDPSSSSR